MPLSLLILALSAFAIGTTEFVIMGLLPDVAADLGVSIPGAGWLVTGYALGVAIGAPFMALATARLPRKAALVALMGIFIIGNLLCALASDYNVLMFARVVTALCHGAFFGIGSVVAANLVPANKRASAVALMFTGLTLANVLGVPLGTALGQEAGWRSTFWAVTVIGVIALIGLIRFLPAKRDEEKLDMRAELAALKVLEELELPSTSQIINAAGKFLIVAANTRDMREKLVTVRKDINSWFLEHTFGLAPEPDGGYKRRMPITLQDAVSQLAEQTGLDQQTCEQAPALLASLRRSTGA